MSEPSFEHLRHSALAMLDDGNAVESVAHVLGVPANLVVAWRVNPLATPASTFVETAPLEIDPAQAPGPQRARLRFRTELVYAASTSFRTISLIMGIGLPAVGIGVIVPILRNSPLTVSNVAPCLMLLLVIGGATKMMLGWVPRILVLGRDSVIAPRLFGQAAMAYPDVAGYTLEPHVLRMGRGATLKGRLLTVASRRPSVKPLTVFLFNAYPINQALLDRLDEVARATHGQPVLPPPASPVRGARPPGRMSFAMLAVVVVLGSLQLLPQFSDAVHALRHGTPPLSALRHVEGRVTTVSACWTRSKRDGGDQAMNLTLVGTAGTTRVTVPCVFDQDSLLLGGPHVVAVDLDPDGTPPDRVYQLALDGRVALAYDVARARQHHDQILPARVIAGLMPVATAFLFATLFVLWRRWRLQHAD